MQNSELAPIVLFVYNRPDCTKLTLEHLKLNVFADQSELYIYSDGPKLNASEEDLKKIKEVRKIISEEKWCKNVHVIESPINVGLANSIISGVSETIKKNGKIIVLEDDLLTSVHFIEYMNDGLNRFATNEKVFQIVGYTVPVNNEFKNAATFLPFSSTWGWGTWSRAWNYFERSPRDYVVLKTDQKICRKFNLDNSFPYSDMLISQMEKGIDSWGITWWWAVFKQKGVCLFPDRTLVANIGFGVDATHTIGKTGNLNKYWLIDYRINYLPNKVIINLKFYSKVKSYYRNYNRKPLISKIINKLYRLWCISIKLS